MKLKNILAISLLTFAAFQANAATVTLIGDDVSFTYDDSTVFGEALVVGNSINFFPTTFFAESLNGEGTVSNNATINVRVEAITEGFSMSVFQLREQGDYFLVGDDATATIGGEFSITSGTKGCDIFNPCRTSDSINAGPLDTLGAYTQWEMGSTIDLADIEDWQNDTSVVMTIENRLTATTLNLGEQAFIEKKFAGVGITVVPVPAAVWLLGSALGGLGFMRRRKAS